MLILSPAGVGCSVWQVQLSHSAKGMARRTRGTLGPQACEVSSVKWQTRSGKQQQQLQQLQHFHNSTIHDQVQSFDINMTTKEGSNSNGNSSGMPSGSCKLPVAKNQLCARGTTATMNDNCDYDGDSGLRND